MESTGLFNAFDNASKHLAAGAKRVILSAPTKTPEQVPTYLLGVNHEKFNPADRQDSVERVMHDQLLGPVAKVIR